MKDKLTTLALSIPLSLCLSSPAISQTEELDEARRISRMVVEDSNGSRVGNCLAVDTAGNAWLSYKVGTRKFSIRASRDKLLGSSFVYFESNDCSGSPYLRNNGGVFPQVGIVTGTSERIIYVEKEGVTPEVRNLNSQYFNGVCDNGVEVNNFDASTYEAEALGTMDFVPPFNTR